MTVWDSRLIFAAAASGLNHIRWLNETKDNGAWAYIGDGDELDREMVMDTINKFFDDNALYIVLTKRDSFKLNKEDIRTALTNLLGKANFSIWDSKFEKVIGFVAANAIMRLGQKIKGSTNKS